MKTDHQERIEEVVAEAVEEEVAERLEKLFHAIKHFKGDRDTINGIARLIEKFSDDLHDFDDDEEEHDK